MNKKHYIAMAGLAGCIPNYCEVYESFESAVDSICEIHELGRVYRARLAKDSYVDLKLKRHGNEYAEITECNCDLACQHSDTELPSNCTLDFCFEHAIKPAISEIWQTITDLMIDVLNYRKYSGTLVAELLAENYQISNIFDDNELQFYGVLPPLEAYSNGKFELVDHAFRLALKAKLGAMLADYVTMKNHGIGIRIFTRDMALTDAFYMYRDFKDSVESYTAVIEDQILDLENETHLEAIEDHLSRLDVSSFAVDPAEQVYCHMTQNSDRIRAYDMALTFDWQQDSNIDSDLVESIAEKLGLIRLDHCDSKIAAKWERIRALLPFNDTGKYSDSPISVDGLSGIDLETIIRVDGTRRHGVLFQSYLSYQIAEIDQIAEFWRYLAVYCQARINQLPLPLID